MTVDEVERRFRAAMEDAVRRIGEDLLGRAQRLAPVEEGTLRASGEVELERNGDRVAAVVSFQTVYAARQHEETTWSHPLGGQAKYLSEPLQENAARYRRILEAAGARALGGS